MVCTSTFALENRLESSLSIDELHENGGVSKVAVELVIDLLCHVSAYYVTTLNVQRHLNRRVTCFYFVRTRDTNSYESNPFWSDRGICYGLFLNYEFFWFPL